MSPRIDRPRPPYVQIGEHYRHLISDGTLAEGDRLPGVAQLAREWDVAPGTAHKALRYLHAARLVDVTTQGTIVRTQRATPASRDRVLMALRGEAIDAERVQVTEVGTVTRPYVAELLGLDDGARIVRREQITYREQQPIMLSVHWLPEALADAAPQLTGTDPVSTLGTVQRTTGRVVRHCDEALSARAADEREANALHISVNTPVLAGVWQCSDEDGVIEYGEYVCPQEHVVTYRYDVPES